ncbi:MAG: hypothetical protein RMI91_10980 [Gemmatales bacterium]|nr:hypothetical protein [Gemmatales bacterium]MDW7995166.1 hypothetical protein [Gemmatales bacterium]
MYDGANDEERLKQIDRQSIAGYFVEMVATVKEDGLDLDLNGRNGKTETFPAAVIIVCKNIENTRELTRVAVPAY